MMKAVVSKIQIFDLYMKVFFDFSFRQPFFPGQYAKIDKNYYSIIEANESEFCIFIKASDYFHVGLEVQIIGPLGNCFYAFDSEDEIILVANGTGISPLISVVKYRSARGFRTHLLYLSNSLSLESIVEIFPCLAGTNLIFWDTKKRGRPDVVEEVNKISKEGYVLFSGSKSLEKELFRSLGDRLVAGK